MGNYFGGQTEQQLQEQKEQEEQEQSSSSNPTYEYDDMDDDALIAMIRKLPLVKLDYSSIKDKSKDIELNNIRLIPMCVELYQKLVIALPKYVAPTEVKRKLTCKKLPYVKPEFTSADIIKRNAEQVIFESTEENRQILKNLYVVLNGPIEYNVTPIKVNEFDEAFKSLEGNADMMGICRHILGSLLEHHKIRLINAFNNIYTNKCSEIFIGKATFIYKGAGDKKEIASYREIVVIPTIINHFHRVLSLRLGNHLIQNKYLNTTIQKGGVLGQNNALLQQILKVKSAIRHATITGKPLVVMFLDIKNAFGSVCRKAMNVIMTKYNVDPVLMKYLETYYDNLQYYVQSKDISTESCMKWKEGLMQGDPLSGSLFNMVFTYVLHYIDTLYKEQYGYEMENIKLLLLAFVDDVALTTTSIDYAMALFAELEKVCLLVGLRFNKAKCSMMLINIPCEQEQVNGFAIRKTVKYLGAYIKDSGDHMESFKDFTKQLWNRMVRLDTSKALTSFQDKIICFNTTVLPYVNINLKFMYDINIDKKRKVINSLNHYLRKWSEGRILKIVSFDNDFVKMLDDEVINKVVSMNTEAQYYDALINFEYSDEPFDSTKEVPYNKINELEQLVDLNIK